MIFDERNEFADATAFGGGTGDRVIGDVIDLGAVPTLRDLGNGQPVYLVVSVDTTFTSGSSSNVYFKLASDSTSDLATSPTVHMQSATYDESALTAGTFLMFTLPVGATYERYLGILGNADVAVTAGAISAYLTLDPHGNVAYPDALDAIP